ncbi:DUF7503 family protein [Halorussus gelatinilyticus]
MSEAPDATIAGYCSKHPRMMGVLFTVGLLTLEAVGQVKAGGGAATAGP